MSALSFLFTDFCPHGIVLNRQKQKTGIPDKGYARLWSLYLPYVGITQIRLRVEAVPLPLSLPDTQAPRF